MHAVTECLKVHRQKKSIFNFQTLEFPANVVKVLDADDTLFTNVGAAVGALLCPLKIIDIGPFSSVATG